MDRAAVTDESGRQPTQPSERDFIRRWSERKLEAAQPAADTADHNAEQPPPEPPGDEDMPPLDSLTTDSDYRPFLSPRVSVYLQQQALRKLFGVPSFNVRDGLDDYDDDFTHFAALGDVITADIRHRLEREAAALAKAQAENSNTDLSPEPTEEPCDDDETANSPEQSQRALDSADLGTDPGDDGADDNA